MSEDITKHVCAAVYVDASLRRQMLSDAFDNPYRAFAPSPCVDTVLVLRHCLAAERRAFHIELGGLGLVIAGWVGATVCMLFVPIVGALVPGSLRSLDVAFSAMVLSQVGALLVQVGSSCAIFALLFLSANSVISGKKAAQLQNPAIDPDIDRPPSAAEDEVFKSIAQWQASDLRVSSRYSPFAGAGVDIGHWSLAMNMARPAVSSKPVRDFDVNELYGQVKNRARGLRIEGLEVFDVICVNGSAVRDGLPFRWTPFSRPYPRVDTSTLLELADPSSSTARRCLCLRVTRWGGDLSLSIFIRFSRAGEYLFIDMSFFLNTPVAEKYRFLERAKPSLVWRVLYFLFLTGIAAPYFSGRLFWRAVRAGERWWRRRGVASEIENNPAFDYGATETPRERVGQKEYRRYFQMLDEEMFEKVIERRFIESVIAFLEERNIDASDLRSQQNLIMSNNYNNTVNVSGGSIGALAMGPWAKASNVVGTIGSKITSLQNAGSPGRGAS